MFSRCAHWAYGGNIFGTFWTTILNVMSGNMLGKWQSNISNVPRMYLVVKGWVNWTSVFNVFIMYSLVSIGPRPQCDGGEGQKQSDSGGVGNRPIYVYRGSEHAQNQTEKRLNDRNNKTWSSVIGGRMEHYLGVKAVAKRRKNDRIVGNMNRKCRNSNRNSTKNQDIVRNIKWCRKSVWRSEIGWKHLWGDAGVYPARCQLQRQENWDRSANEWMPSIGLWRGTWWGPGTSMQVWLEAVARSGSDTGYISVFLGTINPT